jgi:DNA-binding MarR family transcriptional regulator
MDQQTELLREIRDLLVLLAEPAIAKRDESHRVDLRELAGRGKSNAKAVLLMDGTRAQKTIVQESGIDRGNLSRLVKSLREKGLLTPDEQPRLAIAIPANFFESTEK